MVSSNALAVQKYYKSHREHKLAYMQNYYKRPEVKKREFERGRLRCKRLKEDRAKVIEELGAKCYICNRTFPKLILHHRKPYPKAKKRSGWDWTRAVREAKSNPEQFASLCYKCHWIVTLCLRDSNSKEKLFELI